MYYITIVIKINNNKPLPIMATFKSIESNTYSSVTTNLSKPSYRQDFEFNFELQKIDEIISYLNQITLDDKKDDMFFIKGLKNMVK